MKKAYLVIDYWYESQIIVFAETPSKAKVVAMNNNAFCYEDDYLDLRATREKDLDQYASIAIHDYLDWENPEHRKILKSIGWHKID